MGRSLSYKTILHRIHVRHTTNIIQRPLKFAAKIWLQHLHWPLKSLSLLHERPENWKFHLERLATFRLPLKCM